MDVCFPDEILSMFFTGQNASVLAQCRLVCREWARVLEGNTAPAIWAQSGLPVQRTLAVARLAAARWLVVALGPSVMDADTCMYALGVASERGELKKVKWLVAEYGLTARHIRSNKNHALRKACANGHLTLAKWFVVHFALTQDDIQADGDHCLRESCRKGHLQTAKWIVATCSLTGQELYSNIEECMYDACEEGHFEVVKWFHEQVKQHINNVDYVSLIARCCVNGRQDMLRRVLEKHVPDAQHYCVRTGIERACQNGYLEVLRTLCDKIDRVVDSLSSDHLGMASRAGHLEIVKWITNNARMCDNFCTVPLFHACEAGHLEIVKYYIIDLKMADFVRNESRVLRNAVAEGHADIAEWLVDKLGLGLDTEGPSLFNIACARGHLNAVKWLVSKTKYKMGHIHCGLYKACANGEKNIIEWLKTQYTLTAEDFRVNGNEYLRVACQNGHLDLVRWLTTEAGLTAEDVDSIFGTLTGHSQRQQDIIEYLTQI